MILTKDPITKGSPALFTLNKNDLALNSLVTSSVHFSNQANWSLVMINYKSTIHDQPKNLIFDASLSSPTAYFQTSTSADDVFEVQKVIIQDKDGGLLVIPRSLLTTAEAEFDVDINSISGLIFEFFSTPDSLVATGGSVENTLGVNAFAIDTDPITNNQYDISFSITGMNANDCFAIGLTNSLADVSFAQIQNGLVFVPQGGGFDFVGVAASHNLTKKFNAGSSSPMGGTYSDWQAYVLPNQTNVFRFISDPSSGLNLEINGNLIGGYSVFASYVGSVFPFVHFPTIGNKVVSVVNNLA
jgi:hypothetical protein